MQTSNNEAKIEHPQEDSWETNPKVSQARRSLQLELQEDQYYKIESYLWGFFSIAMVLLPTFDFFNPEHNNNIFHAFSANYNRFVLAICAFLFPVVYRLIFNELPLASLRSIWADRKNFKFDNYKVYSDSFKSNSIEEKEILVSNKNLRFSKHAIETKIDELEKSAAISNTSIDLLSKYAENSKQLSERMFSRAGVYLFVGVIISFSGLFFFYSQTLFLTQATSIDMNFVLLIAPKFGILFFLEIVAFFFLRQYRSAMEEFRYYESIKRKREETLALIKYAAENEKSLEPLELVRAESFYSKSTTLNHGETTEILENRKLEKNEIILLEKVIDLVSNSKK